MFSKIIKLACLAASLAFSSLASGQFVTTNGLQFELNGEPFSFAGGNLWTLGATDQGFIGEAITSINQIGYTVIRVAAWIMKDPSAGLLGSFGSDGEVWFQLWENGQPNLNTGANGLALLDSAVQQAEAAGIKFIMCLTNEWPNFGGMMNYVNNLLGEGQSQTEFFTNPTVIDAYKNYKSQIISRYEDSPAIFAWELANEARCQEPDCAGGVLTQWADEISSYIKSLDQNHMVTFGGYGFFNHGEGANNFDFNYDGASGEDYDALIRLENIDLGTMHLYTNDDGAQGPAYGLQWLKDHNDASVAASKPMIVEEMGVNRTSPDLSMPDVLNQYQQYILSSEAIQGSMDWSSQIVSGACPGEGDIYAICQADSFYGKLVTEFVPQMAGKG